MTEIVNLNNSDPAPPPGYQNVLWQKNSTPIGIDPVSGYPISDVSAYVPNNDGTLTNPMTATIYINCPTPETIGLVITGSESTTGGPTIVQSIGGNIPSFGSPGTYAFPGNNTAGNCILIIGLAIGGGTVTDTAGNSYTQLFVYDSIYSSVWIAENIAGGANTVTQSFSEGVVILEITNVPTSGVFDTWTGNNTSGGSFTPTGSITTAEPNELVIAFGGAFNTFGSDPATITDQNGWTPLTQYNAGGYVWLGVFTTPAAVIASYEDGISDTGGGASITAGILAIKGTTVIGTQAADLLDFNNSAGDVLSSVNGLGQFVLPVTSGLPTNTPNGPALSFDEVAGEVDLYSGGAWAPLAGGGGGGGGTPIEEIPGGTIDGTNTAFTLSQTPVAGTLLLTRNGVKQNQVTVTSPPDFILSGVDIAFIVPPAAGSQPDVIIAQYWYA